MEEQDTTLTPTNQELDSAQEELNRRYLALCEERRKKKQGQKKLGYRSKRTLNGTLYGSKKNW